MSLQTRLSSLITAIGSDIKTLSTTVATKASNTDVGNYWQVNRRPYQIPNLVVGQDNTSAINTAIANAAPYDTLVIPPGSWTHSAVITHAKDDVAVDGYGARLVATVPTAAAYRVSGNRARLRGFTHEVQGVTSRGSGDNSNTCPFFVTGAADVFMEDLASIGSLDVGFFFFAALRSRVRDIVSADSFADGVHVTYGSRDCVFDGVIINNPGDDGFAVVSYSNDAAISQNIRASRIRVTNGSARGVSVVGGSDIRYEGVDIYRTRGSGVYIAIESGTTDSFPVTNVKVVGGNITDGNWDSSLDTGQINITNQKSGTLITNALVEGFTVEGNRKFSTAESYVKVGTSNGSGGRMIGIILRDLWLRGGLSDGAPGWVFPDGVSTATVANGSYLYESGSGTGVTTNSEGYTVSGTTNITDPSTTTSAPGLTVQRVRVGPTYATNTDLKSTQAQVAAIPVPTTSYLGTSFSTSTTTPSAPQGSFQRTGLAAGTYEFTVEGTFTAGGSGIAMTMNGGDAIFETITYNSSATASTYVGGTTLNQTFSLSNSVSNSQAPFRISGIVVFNTSNASFSFLVASNTSGTIMKVNAGTRMTLRKIA